MSNELTPNELRNLWRSREVEKVTLTMDEIRGRAARFEQCVQRRNLREYIVSAIVIVFFAMYVWHAPGWRKSPGLLLIAGVVFSMFQVHRRGARSLPADPGRTTFLQFHRRELERQRDALSSVFRWYLAPVVPGCAAMIAVAAIDRGFNLPLLIGLVVMVGGFVVVWILNVRGAARLQRRIDEIKAMECDDA